jgi:DNA-binding CsgD family transcriptional regulator/tetratricopeptide (TPR) repeat protein
VSAALLERDTEQACLDAALDEAAHGAGSVVLVAGEAGIGKTSLVRAFVQAREGQARVLFGACDDLVTPRPLGPLRDAARRVGGPLAAALATGDRDGVLSALLGELSAGPLPTVLVMEDVHWADDATLDVLRFVGRRIADLPAVLVVTYRDEEIGPALLRVLGALGGSRVRRLTPSRLSRVSVARLAGGTAATSAPLFRLTRGNPFFVSEVVAAGGSGDTVPATVVDAVLARVARLELPEQAALEQLCVVPAQLDLGLARALLGDLGVLAGPERAGLLEVRPGAVAFRHELARRGVEDSLPVGVRMQRNARVLAALLDGSEPDLARVVHHAVAAGDDATVAAHAPAAARAANRAGAYAQEAALQEHALRSAHLLGPGEEAVLWVERTSALFSLDRLPEALDAGRRAAALCEKALAENGDPASLAAALTALALVHWALSDPAQCLAAAERAVRVLEPGGDSPQRAYTLAYYGGFLGTVDRDTESLAAAVAARDMAARLQVPHLVALGEIACGTARLKLGDPGGTDDLRTGIAGAAAAAAHVITMTGYNLLVQDLWHSGRHAEADRFAADATAYAQQRDVRVYLDHITAYAMQVRAVRGEWDAAEAGLRRLDGASDTGSVRHSLPALARLAVRRGTDDADDVLERAWTAALRTDNRYPIIPAALARIERAWLTGRPADAADAVRELAPRVAVAGAEHARADLARWLRRLGEPADAFPGCPPEYAAGLRGDWRAAAMAFAERGMPYEQALELADSGDVDAMVEGLRLLDDLGARPAAAVVRRRLREHGVAAVPRGPKPETRANPAGLTERQAEILRLLAGGRTNAEIAAKLVLSVRTVDHHVSAVLQKLGVTTRREARAAADRLGLLEPAG